MKVFKIIFLLLATLAAGTSATRADELSELVAAVAAAMDSTMMTHDVARPNLGNNKHRYKAKTANTDISIEFLTGIWKSMNMLALEAYRRNNEESEYDNFVSPTLGRQDFFRPVGGIITSKFGWRPQFQRVHHGVDLHLNIGDTVRAALSGRVERISFDAQGYGHYVVLSHPDGMETLYGHLQYALVGQGQTIIAGQPVGIGGNTGNSTGPHLHFETRIDGVAIDPMLLFDFYGNAKWYAYESTSAVKTTPKGPSYSHQSKSLKKEDTYIVRYGDTVESVARQAGISTMRLCQLNMLNERDPLPIGRMLKLH